MIHFGPNRTETRWVPFPKIPISQAPTSLEEGIGEERTALLSEMDLTERVGEDDLKRAGPPYLKWLVDGELDRLEFLRGRSIVLIGEFFGSDREEGGKRGREGGRTDDRADRLLLFLCSSLLRSGRWSRQVQVVSPRYPILRLRSPLRVSSDGPGLERRSSPFFSSFSFFLFSSRRP